MAANTLQALKLNAMRRKRERLISKIIYEKRYQLFRGLVLCCCGASFAAIVWCAWDMSA